MKFLLFILLLTLNTSIFCQDIIIKNDKSEIKSKVLEITDDYIKYKKFDMQSGPIYNIKKTDVFMIIYQNGTKEYMEAAPAPSTSIVQNKSEQVLRSNSSAASFQTVAATPVIADSTELKKLDDFVTTFAVDDGFTSIDFESNYKIAKYHQGGLYVGLSGYSNLLSGSNVAYTYGLYPYLEYKYSPGGRKNLYLWANAGYNFSSTDVKYYDIYGYTTTTVSSEGFLWELGADYFFSKHIGCTVYSTKLSGVWFGLAFRKSW